MRPEPAVFRATYRIQLHQGFQFKDVVGLLGYLEDLGVSHLYFSPVLESVRGSVHGYDGVDPSRISTERGGSTGLNRLLSEVEHFQNKGRGLEGVVIDIVPNHLATSSQNPYWWDVLEKGTRSPYRDCFDVTGKRVVLPVLSDTLENVLERGELKLELHPRHGLVFGHHNDTFPLSSASTSQILARFTRLTGFRVPGDNENFKRAIGAPHAPKWRSALKRYLTSIDSATMLRLCKAQAYSLEFWRTGISKINYRRFFDIHQLVGLRVEDPAVFEWLHARIFELSQNHRSIHGLRVDHIDGLSDPKQYLHRLRKQFEYIWVEKILSEDETIPYEWPVRGSTGYDFLNCVSKIFVNENGNQRIHDYYLRHVDGRWTLFPDCVYASKKEVLGLLFEVELRNLVDGFFSYCVKINETLGFTKAEVTNALVELTACLKVYRIYFRPDQDANTIGQDDRKWLLDAYEDAIHRRNVLSQKALEWLVNFFLDDRRHDEEKRLLLTRWQQLSGPVMAKGLEDTALYRYFPLISLNAVGGQPDWSYNNVTEFHSFNEERLKSHPLTLNASTTHDTKRNEDVRARVHVLSEAPEKWLAAFESWHRMNLRLKEKINDIPAPSVAFEYYIYQTLLGVWPLDCKIDSQLRTRLRDHFLKAAKEAKQETSWIYPSLKYEEALIHFVDKLLDEKRNKKFLDSVSEFAEQTAFFGAINSLSEITLKILSPGLPDTYQGTETWSYYLVDPDNRRPVNYDDLFRMSARAQKIEKQGRTLFPSSVTKNWKTGEIKFRLIRQLLQLRRADPILFQQGRYIPLMTQGEKAMNVLGFARVLEQQWVLVLVPRFLTGLNPRGELSIPRSFWKDTALSLPVDAPVNWVNLLTRRHVTAETQESSNHVLSLQEAFGGMPIAVLASKNPRKNSPPGVYS